jgi:PAS domain S-box-containing protein
MSRVDGGVRLKLLAAVAEAVATAADERSLLERTTLLLRDAFYPDNCGFLLLEPGGRTLRHAPSFHAARGQDRLHPIELGQGVVGQVAQSGTARRLDDVRLAPDYLAGEPDMRSEICLPLRVGSHVLGVFDAESRTEAAFTSEDEWLLTVVAVSVAGALDRLRSSEALRESGELYRAYFTGSPVALFVCGSDGRFQEANGALCALTGRSPEELLGFSIADLLETTDAALVAERLLGLLSLGGGPSEVRVRGRDGGARHCIVYASPFGRERLLGLLLDITDRREAEGRLRESEERFRCLSEASLEAIFIHDEGRIVDVNQALCDLGGYSWHELVGREGLEIVAPEYRQRVYWSLLTGHQGAYEVEVLTRDGRRKPVELQGRSFSIRGRTLRVVAVRDLTPRYQAAAVRDSLVRELEARTVELERFGYAITHDLKAPLVTVKGFADHLARDVREGRSDRLEQDARRIRDAVERLQRLVEDLLVFSRAGQPVGPPVAAAVGDLVRDALRLPGTRFGASGVRLELAACLPPVYGDRARLVQVFASLLDHAARFAAPVDPLVRVEARASQDGMATLVVRDNGAGFDGWDGGRGPDPFEKLDSRTGGPGVGLAAAKRVVESHGGRVWLEAAGTGGGTLVCLTLPLPPEGSREAVLVREAAARPRGSASPAGERRGT